MSDVTSPDCLAGGGDMGALMRSIDWSKTAIGPTSEWSQALRTTVGLLLRNRFPLILWWGPEFTQFYNDTYRPILGDKHPMSMGQPASVCWSEIWHIIGPMIEAPFSGLPATARDDLFLLIDRKGFVEETHFKVAYSPVPDEIVSQTGIGGVLATVAETTEQVYGERQLSTLRVLGARAAEAKTPEQACQAAAVTLATNTFDVPFALFYLLEPGGKQARLAASCGFDETGPASPALIDIEYEKSWPIRSVVQHGETKVLSDLHQMFGPLPKGKWSESPHAAILLPLTTPDQPYAYGVLIAGLSPHREISEGYRTFFDLAAGQVTTAIRNARAYQEERRRAEALAELDRAKTIFFSNVSHEFRTPLTLMLGPLEDLLRVDLPPEEKDEVSLIHRNGLRLLKLVNTLLDFSRIEAGRVHAVYEATDLAAYTAELASVFRSAVEKGGLSLNVDCPALPEPVYVDREMWEKIVLNLLSNAFKFTFEGEISVSLRWLGDHVDLEVKDTGTGIASHELPHLFERFHRIRGARSRSHEGTGIGLSLVSELVKLHGGSIKAASTPGQGTTFTVTVPTGRAHLPSDRIGAARTLSSTSTGKASFVEEALKWLPEGISSDSDLAQSRPAYAPADGSRARVLLADDNADMRGYIRRLLSEHYEVEAVTDGGAALDAALRNPPDLVLTDIMMPFLDGFGLVKALREDFRTQSIPVIFLSARAGEEAKVEGMGAGADDYLVKPFSARELMARVAAHLQMAHIRREASQREQELRCEAERRASELALSENRYRSLFENMLDGFAYCKMLYDDRDRPVDFVYLGVNSAFEKLTGLKDVVGKRVTEAIPGIREVHPELFDIYSRVALTGRPERFETELKPLGIWLSISVYSTECEYFVVVFENITQRKLIDEALRQSEQHYRLLFETIPNGVVYQDADGTILSMNPPAERILGQTQAEFLGSSSVGQEHFTIREDGSPFPGINHPAMVALQTWQEVRDVVMGIYNPRENCYRWINTDAIPLFRPGENKPYQVYTSFEDITHRKLMEEIARIEERRLRSISRISQHNPKSARELLDYALDEAIALSESKLGYILYYSEENREFTLHAWSKEAMKECSIAHPPTVYQLDSTGIWGEAVRQRRPIVINDFLAPNPLKKGYPEGHARIFRFMTVPVFIDDHIVAVVAVANKATDYSDQDVNQLIMMMDLVWSIAERKMAEEALRESEERYRAFFESSIDAIFITTPDGGIEAANAEACRMFGMTEEELKKEGRGAVIDASDQRIKAALEERARTGRFRGELNFKRKDGTIIPVDDSNVLFTDRNGRKKTVMILRDITQRRQMEDELRRSKDELEQRVQERTAELQKANLALIESEERFRVGLKNSPIAVFNQDRDLRYTWVYNPTPGLREDIILGKTDKDIFPPEDAAELTKIKRRVLESGIGERAEVRVTVNGVEVFSDLTVEPLYNATGEIEGITCATMDITYRKKAEAELIKAKDLAQEAVEAKAAFLANMSHELRTPMNAVIGFSSLLLDDSLTPDQKDYVERIRIGGEALLALINDILEFSKIEKSKVNIEHQPLSLRHCIEEALGMVAVKASYKGLNLSYTISYGTPDAIIGDSGRLRQVLLNLLSNAVKFTDVGEVSVSVSSKALENNKQQILFRVKDTGIGIPEDKMNMLFQPFSQLEYNLSLKRDGTGLGLAISKSLVQLMGGMIWADSIPEVGSTFHFTIEAEIASDKIVDSGSTAKDAYENLAEKKPLRILVAEDVPSNQKMLVEMLRRMGYRADTTADGREVLEALELLPYDLILMDIKMPEMDGLEAARQIRKRWPAEKQPRIIAITAYAMEGDREKCLEAGMDGYIAKPVQMGELAEVLNRFALKTQ